MKRHEFADILLFDLGGVLGVWDGMRPLVDLSPRLQTEEEARAFWLDSPWVRSFETGRTSKDEFAKGVVSELELPVSPDRFLELFISWDKGPMPGAADLLDLLRENFFLACLSNNNALHWERLDGLASFSSRFERTYLSHEIGLMKPDLEIFRYVIADLGAPAERILFFDDSPQCIEAARKCAMQAQLVKGPKDVCEALETLGLIFETKPSF